MGRFKVPTKIIEIPQTGENFSVRGISLVDVSDILEEYGAVIAAVFTSRIKEVANGLSDADISMLGKALLKQCPEAAAKIIALAADDPDNVKDFARLPFPVQTEALDKIVRLTFHSDDDIKKLIETVIGGAEGISRLVSMLKLPTNLSQVGLSA